jgi:hypothetical protein
MAAWDGYAQVAAGGRDYTAVAANSTAALLGANGTIGDTLDYVWVFPGSTTPGTLTILDGAVTVWTLTGATLASIQPFPVPMNARAKNAGGWKITTGAGLSATGFGLFTR